MPELSAPSAHLIAALFIAFSARGEGARLPGTVPLPPGRFLSSFYVTAAFGPKSL